MKNIFKARINAYDKITRNTLIIGCSVAEHEAILRCGKNWRQDYQRRRLKERKKIFPILSIIWPQKLPL